MSRCARHISPFPGRELASATRIGLRLSAIWLLVAAPAIAADLANANRTSVLVVGAYHFVSKANLINMRVDDPLSPARQAQIKVLVNRLMAFHPTKVVLEQTSGTSDVEQHYQDYLHDRWPLEPSENYQIGFRLAKQL